MIWRILMRIFPVALALFLLFILNACDAPMDSDNGQEPADAPIVVESEEAYYG